MKIGKEVTQIDIQCLADYRKGVAELDAGLPQNLTNLASSLAMSLGVTKDDWRLIQVYYQRLFRHHNLKGNHKRLWRGMVNMITPEHRKSCKEELRGLGWDI